MNTVLYRQGYHLLAYLVLALLLSLSARVLPGSEHRLWGLSAAGWVAVSWIFAGISQAWVMLFWRLELLHGGISARLGTAGFTVHRIGYVVLFALRFLPLAPLSLATADTIAVPLWLNLLLFAVTTPLILWALHGAVFYFGLDRLAGVDHFDPTYRGQPLELRGIYRHIPNAVYSVGLLALFHPGLLWQSALGLATAAVHFAFVWVHYFCTEKPDLDLIYGSRPGARRDNAA